MRTCTMCNETKLDNSFYKYKYYKSQCKKCDNQLSIKYSRTIKGLISKIYSHQKSTSKRRLHDMPNYTIQDLSNFILSQDNFEELYNNWVKSKYQKDLRPSINRLDNLKGYSFDNIELITWRENYMKDIDRNRKLAVKSNMRPILQFTRKGKFINGYESIMSAGRNTKINPSQILQVCKNFRKTAGNYIWKYK